MANILIKTINYITAGKKQKFVDLDIGYRPEDYNYDILANELLSFKIGQGNVSIRMTETFLDDYIIKYLKNEYICGAVYATSIDKYQDLYPNSKTNTDNLYSIFDKENNVIIHNLYDVKDVCIQSSIKNKDGNDLEFYGPTISSNLLGITQLENFTYGLTNRTTNSYNFQNTDLLDQRPLYEDKEHLIFDNDYKFQISSNNIKTFLYKTNTSEQDAFQISCNLSGIPYNYILELQNEDSFNDYESGDIYGDSIICKNVYDSMYSMNMPSSNRLENCRQYKSIKNCGNELFLTYQDDIHYTKHVDISSNDGIMVEDTYRDQDGRYTWQKVEHIGSINRYSTSNLHRTNMFSIKIDNTGIDSLEITNGLQQLKNKIIFDIETNVKDLVKKLAPVTSQLLKVEVE